jgi:protein-S-isoprenylcysteine O-methyltransferase Ste14
MYLSELLLMFGWVFFFGSLSVLIGLIAWWAIFNYYQVPSEERILEASFGESYRAYKGKVSRWIGRRQ